MFEIEKLKKMEIYNDLENCLRKLANQIPEKDEGSASNWVNSRFLRSDHGRSRNGMPKRKFFIRWDLLNFFRPWKLSNMYVKCVYASRDGIHVTYARTATDMDGTLHTDLWKYETSKYVEKSKNHFSIIWTSSKVVLI